MDLTQMTGSCLCSAIRYKIVAEPITLYACHCTDCQTASGASFVLTMNLPINGIEIIRGEPRAFERPRADGRKKNIYRCPICLTALWGAQIQSADYINIYAGTLDDTSSLNPVAHIWVRSAQPWIVLPKEVLVYEKQPPNMQPIVHAWQEQRI